MIFALVFPGLVSAFGIFTALFAFKDLMWLLIANSETKATALSSALGKIQSAYSVEYPQLMAASLIAILPVLILFFFFQKSFMQGIATTGGKL